MINIIVILRNFFFRKKDVPTRPHSIKEKPMIREFTPECLELLNKEFQFVSTTLSFTTQKFKLLCNQGLNSQVLQKVIDELQVEKTKLEVQIYALRDQLES